MMSFLNQKHGRSLEDLGTLVPRGGPSPDVAALSRQVPIHRHSLPVVAEVTGQVAPVERRVAPMDGAVMVRAHEHQVVEGIVAAPAQPPDMVALTERLAVLVDGIPPVDLAVAVVGDTRRRTLRSKKQRRTGAISA